VKRESMRRRLLRSAADDLSAGAKTPEGTNRGRLRRRDKRALM
jgi:hypothetical protein